MLRLLPLVALLALFSIAGCDTQQEPTALSPVPLQLSPLASDLVGHSADFGLDLFAQVADREDGNLMLSPFSASVALTMLMNGADGETYDQIHAMLGYGPDQDLDAVNQAYESLRTQLLAADPAVRLDIANAAFTNSRFTSATPFKSPFLDALTGPFDAIVRDLDFADPATLDAVNGWASENTNGRVPRVLDEIERGLVLLLMNAVYFDGVWSTPFDPDETADSGFRLADGETVSVPTMVGTVQARTAVGDGYQAAEIPYGRGNLSMVVVVPDGGVADAAARLRDGLWDEITARFDAASDWGEVDVRMPRFEFSTGETLNADLKALGMTDAFDARVADLTRMHDNRSLEVSFVKQNSFVTVDERGTEAAAVTTVGVRATSLGPHLFADRPFVFAIRERTSGTLLFIGQVADPR